MRARNLLTQNRPSSDRCSSSLLFFVVCRSGEIAVLVSVRRTRSALADTFANLLRLEKDTLDHCAEDFPKLRKVCARKIFCVLRAHIFSFVR